LNLGVKVTRWAKLGTAIARNKPTKLIILFVRFMTASSLFALVLAVH
jgi:hypothetical protein